MNNEQEQVQQPQGWKDITITLDMPLGAFLSFINALNQRIAQIEDLVQIPFNNQMITLTQYYAIQAAEAQKQQRAQAEAGNEEIMEDALPDNPEHQGA